MSQRQQDAACRRGVDKLRAQLADLLRPQTKLKVTEKDNKKKMIHSLLSTYAGYVMDGHSDDVLSADDLLDQVVVLAKDECEENTKKAEKGQVIKILSFESAAFVVNLALQKEDVALNNPTILSYISAFIQCSFKDEDMIQQSIASHCARYFRLCQIAAMDHSQLSNVWRSAWSWLYSAAKARNSRLLEHFTDVVKEIARSVDQTNFAASPHAFIDELFDSASRMWNQLELRYSVRSGYTAWLLHAMQAVCDMWGGSERVRLAQRLHAVIEQLQLTHNCIFESERKSECVTASWPLVDSWLRLATGDSHPALPLNSHQASTARGALSTCMSSLAKEITKDRSSPSHWLPSSSDCARVARLVWADACGPQAEDEPTPKRSKDMPVIECLSECDWSRWCSEPRITPGMRTTALLIIEQLLCKWPGSIPTHILAPLANRVWLQRIECTGEIRGVFCSVLATLIDVNSSGQAVIEPRMMDSMWEWCTGEEICEGTVRVAEALIKADALSHSSRSLASTLTRWLVCHKTVGASFVRVASLLAHLDFDEAAFLKKEECARPSSSSSLNSTGLLTQIKPEEGRAGSGGKASVWRLRRQLVSALLSSHLIEVAHPIAQLCQWRRVEGKDDECVVIDEMVLHVLEECRKVLESVHEPQSSLSAWRMANAVAWALDTLDRQTALDIRGEADVLVDVCSCVSRMARRLPDGMGEWLHVGQWPMRLGRSVVEVIEELAARDSRLFARLISIDSACTVELTTAVGDSGVLAECGRLWAARSTHPLPASFPLDVGRLLCHTLRQLENTMDALILTKDYVHMCSDKEKATAIETCRLLIENDPDNEDDVDRVTVYWRQWAEIVSANGMLCDLFDVVRPHASPCVMAGAERLSSLSSQQLLCLLGGCLNASSFDPLPLPSLLSALLESSGDAWRMHPKAILAVLRAGDEAVEACLACVPRFQKHVEFHAAYLSEKGVRHRCVREERSQGELDVQCVFRMDAGRWAEMGEAVFEEYMQRPHLLLAELRRQPAVFSHLHLEHRFLATLESICDSRPEEFPNDAAFPFMLVVCTSAVAVVQKAVESVACLDALRCAWEEVEEKWPALVSMNTGLRIWQTLSPLLPSDDWMNTQEKKAHEVATAAANKFSTEMIQEQASDVYYLRDMWTHFDSLLEANPSLITEGHLQRLHCVWAACPASRPIMARSLSRWPRPLLPRLLEWGRVRYWVYGRLSDAGDCGERDVGLCLAAISSDAGDEHGPRFLKPIDTDSLEVEDALREAGESVSSSVSLLTWLISDAVRDNALDVSAWQLYPQEIALYALHSPELCRLLLPFVVQWITATKNDLINAVLERCARLLNDTFDVDEHRACALCVAEVMNAIGLPRLDMAMSIWSGGAGLECGPVIVQQLSSAGLIKEAGVFLDIMLQSCISPSRSLWLFGACALPRELMCARLDWLCESGERSGVDALPLEQQATPAASLLTAIADRDWNAVASAVAADSETGYKAVHFSGHDGHPKAEWRDAWRLRQWDKKAPAKSLDSLDACLFTMIGAHSLMGGDARKRIAQQIGSHLSRGGVLDEVELPRACELSQWTELRLSDSDRLDRLLEMPEWTDDGLVLERKLAARSSLGFSLVHRANVDVQARQPPTFDLPQLFRKQHAIVDAHVASLVECRALRPAVGVLNEWLSKCESLADGGVAAQKTRVLQCSLLVKSGEHALAEQKLRQLAESCEDADAGSEALLVLAHLQDRHIVDVDAAIHSLKQAASHEPPSGGTSSPQQQWRVLVALFQLASRQLGELEAYCKSSDFATKKEAVATYKKKMDAKSMTMDATVRHRTMAELRCEKGDIERTEKRLSECAVMTVETGLRALTVCAGPQQATEVLFPLLAILFRYDHNGLVADELRAHTRRMPTSIWLAAASHITSQLFSSSLLSTHVQTMMIKLVCDFPYHVLPCLLLYDRNPKHRENLMRVVKGAIRVSGVAKYDKAKHEKIVQLLMDVHRTVYLPFATVDMNDRTVFRVEKTGEGREQRVVHHILSTYPLMKRQDLRELPLPTVELPIPSPGDYSLEGAVCWSKVSPQVKQADGLSKPKVLVVLGSDGLKRRLIWKTEDVRQDALVQQMFTLVNTVLTSGSGGRTRRPLRTYVVVPLGMEKADASGIIEWCSDTQSLKDILCGSDRVSGLHRQMRPMDITALQGMKEMGEANRENRNQAEVFKSICERLQPVFRHFFYLRYPSVGEYAEKLENYRRSLAEWSIVGYAVGLGDRHASNILFEPDTARFVHIDLGMILEHSRRVLPVPERVPFRMTRDLVDPILADGVHGKLAAIATETMKSLRENQQVLLGVASLLLHQRMSNYVDADNNADEDSPSLMSRNAMSRLRDKLSGRDASRTAQTEATQVRRLLNEATNMGNLASIFQGWMPFL